MKSAAEWSIWKCLQIATEGAFVMMDTFRLALESVFLRLTVLLLVKVSLRQGGILICPVFTSDRDNWTVIEPT